MSISSFKQGGISITLSVEVIAEMARARFNIPNDLNSIEHEVSSWNDPAHIEIMFYNDGERGGGDDGE